MDVCRTEIHGQIAHFDLISNFETDIILIGNFAKLWNEWPSLRFAGKIQTYHAISQYLTVIYTYFNVSVSICNHHMNDFTSDTSVFYCFYSVSGFCVLPPWENWLSTVIIVHRGVTQVPTISPVKYFVNLGSPNLTSGLFNTLGECYKLKQFLMSFLFDNSLWLNCFSHLLIHVGSSSVFRQEYRNLDWDINYITFKLRKWVEKWIGYQVLVTFPW